MTWHFYPAVIVLSRLRARLLAVELTGMDPTICPEPFLAAIDYPSTEGGKDILTGKQFYVLYF